MVFPVVKKIVSVTNIDQSLILMGKRGFTMYVIGLSTAKTSVLKPLVRKVLVFMFMFLFMYFNVYVVL